MQRAVDAQTQPSIGCRRSGPRGPLIAHTRSRQSRQPDCQADIARLIARLILVRTFCTVIKAARRRAARAREVGRLPCRFAPGRRPPRRAAISESGGPYVDLRVSVACHQHGTTVS